MVYIHMPSVTYINLTIHNDFANQRFAQAHYFLTYTKFSFIKSHFTIRKGKIQ